MRRSAGALVHRRRIGFLVVRAAALAGLSVGARFHQSTPVQVGRREGHEPHDLTIIAYLPQAARLYRAAPTTRRR